MAIWVRGSELSCKQTCYLNLATQKLMLSFGGYSRQRYHYFTEVREITSEMLIIVTYSPVLNSTKDWFKPQPGRRKPRGATSSI